jgi:hypothetical protein
MHLTNTLMIKKLILEHFSDKEVNVDTKMI